MNFVWNPAVFTEAVRQVVLALVLFQIINWTETQIAGALMALSAVLALFTIQTTTPNTTLENAGTSKTQVVEAAKQNAAAGTPGGTGAPGTPGGAGGSEAPRGLGNFSDKGTRGLMLALLLVPALAFSACASKKKPVVLVGQSAVITVDSIGTISDAVAALNLPPATELKIQRVLFNANEKLAPLPGLIIAIDNATKAGETATTEVDKALAYLAEGAKYIDSLNADLKAIPTAAAVLRLVTEVQLAITRAQSLIEQVKAPIPRAQREGKVIEAIAAIGDINAGRGHLVLAN
jgi:hypothetical protein